MTIQKLPVQGLLRKFIEHRVIKPKLIPRHSPPSDQLHVLNKRCIHQCIVCLAFLL